MLVKELFENVEVYNEIAEKVKGLKIGVCAFLIETDSLIAFGITDERFVGSPKWYFTNWKDFEENLENEYSPEICMLAHGALDEHNNCWIRSDSVVCKGYSLMFEFRFL